MCGRYASTHSATALATIYQADLDPDLDLDQDFGPDADQHADQHAGAEPRAAPVQPSHGARPARPSYNVAPTDSVRIVRLAGGRRVVSTARWGLLPPWASEPRMGARMINARVETVATSRAYRGPYARRRCLVPADGWYEWRRAAGGGPTQPYYLTPQDGELLSFAGLWEMWRPQRMVTCTILTTAAVGDLRLVHDRMPLTLSADRWSSWLGEDPDESAGFRDVPRDSAGVREAPGESAGPGGSDGGVCGEFLACQGLDWARGIASRPVGRAVGNVRNDSPSLIQPVTMGQLGVEAVEATDMTLF